MLLREYEKLIITQGKRLSAMTKTHKRESNLLNENKNEEEEE